MLEKNEGTINNELSRNTGSIEKKTQKEDKQYNMYNTLNSKRCTTRTPPKN
jgi:hypothetical protein